MNYTNSIPIYLQVVDSIKEKLITGEIGPGDKLPSGRDLALQYTINPNTAARVYQTLEAEQLCFSRRGLGTFATEDPVRVKSLKNEMAQSLIEHFLEGMQRIGIPPEEAADMLGNRS